MSSHNLVAAKDPEEGSVNIATIENYKMSPLKVHAPKKRKYFYQ